MSGSGKKKLILPLCIIIGCIFTGLGIFYYVNHLLTTPVTIEDIEIDTEAVLKLKALDQISKKNGITEWKLKATSASLLKEQDKAVLETVTVEFYTKDATVVSLSADQGTLNTKTHDLVFTSNVVVHHQGYTLTSETLHYDKKPHIIHTDSRVLLEGDGASLEADALETRLNRNRIILKGHVKGNFSENFSLP